METKTFEEAGMSPEGIARFLEEQAIADRQNIIQHGKTGTRRLRLKLLAAQQGRCKLCQNNIDISQGKQACYDEQCKHIVCRRCMQYLTALRNALKEGITAEIVEAYGQPTT